MRLIDADALEKKLHELALDEWNQRASTSWSNALLECEDIVYNAPTVDAVEVVRCRDCAYWGTKVVYANGERADCLNFDFVTPCDFFCKWGERREDGKVDGTE